MKKILIVLILALFCAGVFADELSERQQKWWTEAGLGLFVHFGPYAVYGGEYKGKQSGGAEWIEKNYLIPMNEYTATAKTFNPVKFNADEWIKKASDAGVKYILFTTKHHDGFANFKTDASDFSLWNYQQKDLVADLAKACRKYGVRLGLYYSHNMDWHEKNGGGGQKEVFESKGWHPNNTWDWPEDYENYNIEQYLNDKSYPQVKELLTNYGDVSVIWFDCNWGINYEQAKKFRDIVKGLQPKCMINSRIYEGSFEFADYWGLGDNSVSAKPTESRTESIITLNDNWGWCKHDHNWKTSDNVLSTLAKCVSVNSNLVINVGPKPDGTWPEEADAIFADIAKWMKTNKQSIHGNGPANGTKMNPMNCEDYVFTKKGHDLYLHFLADVEEVNLYNLKTKVSRVRVLGEPYKITWSQNKDDYSLNIKCDGKTKMTVLKIVCKGDIIISDEINEQNHAFSLNAINGTATKAVKDSINEQNTVTNWKDTEQNISWDIVCKDPGEYKVTLITMADFQTEWLGGHSIYMTVNGKKYPSCIMKNDGFTESSSQAWKTVRSEIGTVILDTKGKNTVMISADSIKEKAEGVRFTKLLLEKVK